MKLFELCRVADIDCPAFAKDVEIMAICDDSRAVIPNSLFVCIKGFTADSHEKAGEAVQKGACAVLCQLGSTADVPDNIIVLYTKNTRRALAFLYHAWYGFPGEKLKLIGVTGTNGKTSVTHLLRIILESALYRCGLIGTVGCFSGERALERSIRDPLANMTTPDPHDLYRMLAEMVDDGVEYVLMEVTSHALFLEKTAPLSFTAAIFTNLTEDHLDLHGNMEHYAESKARLFQQSKLALINCDDPYTEFIKQASAGRTVTCTAQNAMADYSAKEITIASGGISYRLSTGSSNILIGCPIPGEFTVMNSLQAAACALELGISAATVKEGLASAHGISGRMERLRMGIAADFDVFIDYAHTPDALENLLSTAKKLCKKGKLTLLFGCGGNRDRRKRPMMGRIAESLADRVILTSDNPRFEDPEEIIKEIKAGMTDLSHVTVIPNREAAIIYAVTHAEQGELILLAGKGHEQYEIIGNTRRPFNEKEIVYKALEQKCFRGNDTEI